MSYSLLTARKLYVLLCVQRKTPDDVQTNCPKHVEFYSKTKFEKLVHLLGFIIRIYHAARSPKRQIKRKIATMATKECWLSTSDSGQKAIWRVYISSHIGPEKPFTINGWIAAIFMFPVVVTPCCQIGHCRFFRETGCLYYQGTTTTAAAKNVTITYHCR